MVQLKLTSSTLLGTTPGDNVENERVCFCFSKLYHLSFLTEYLTHNKVLAHVFLHFFQHGKIMLRCRYNALLFVGSVSICKVLCMIMHDYIIKECVMCV